MGTEHIVMFSKDRGQIWSEVLIFVRPVRKSTHVTKWSGHWSLSSSSCEITWCGHFHIYSMKDSLILNQDSPGQLRSPTARGPRKIMKIGSKAFLQKKGEMASKKRSSFGNKLGRKIPKCQFKSHQKFKTLEVKINVYKWNIIMFERGYIYKCLFLNCHVSFRESSIWVKSNTLWTLHPTANEKQQNWHLCYILILPPKKIICTLKIDGWKMSFPIEIVPFLRDMVIFGEQFSFRNIMLRFSIWNHWLCRLAFCSKCLINGVSWFP